jgi:lipoate-protein ligase A
MYLDLFYADQVEKTGMPILRFYTWRPYCLSIGHHQKLADVDVQLVKKSGFDLVRRPTGGSAIFHSEELTYAFIVPLDRLSHHEIYHLFHRFLAQALKNCGYPVELSYDVKAGSYLNQSSETFACFNRSAQSEIQYAGKKVVGSAQKLLKSAVLQHGSIMLGSEHERIIDFLRIDERQKQEQRKVLQEKSITLNQILPGALSKPKLIDALLNVFEQVSTGRFYYKYSTADELNQAMQFKDLVAV